MSIGLDLGSSEFRSIIPELGRLIARRTPAQYVILRQSTVYQTLLEQLRIPILRCDSHYIVLGGQADQVGDLVQLPRIPLLPEGALLSRDSVSRQLCDMLLETILPPSLPVESAIQCVLPLHGCRQGDATRRFLIQILKRRFADLSVVPPATALMLAEGAAQGFGGLAIVIGATSTSYGLFHSGQELLHRTVPIGSRQIIAALSRERHHYIWDAQGNKLLDLRWGDGLQHDVGLDLSRPRTGEEELLAARYGELLATVLGRIASDVSSLDHRLLPRQHVPVLLDGGPVHLAGFVWLFRAVLAESPLPFRIRDIQISRPDPFRLARGALIAGELHPFADAA